jgi:hypothetical protein
MHGPQDLGQVVRSIYVRPEYQTWSNGHACSTARYSYAILWSPIWLFI